MVRKTLVARILLPAGIEAMLFSCPKLCLLMTSCPLHHRARLASSGLALMLVFSCGNR